jgi:hypothetical protein
MKQILIELDDRCARDLERVAPSKKRLRAEFVRQAIRRAIDLALDRSTEHAYRVRPMSDEGEAFDLVGWDEGNALARIARSKKAPRRRARARSKSAA